MINFMKVKNIFFIISLVFIIPSAYFLIRFGLKPAVDFTGGTLLEFQIQSDQEITTTQLKDISQEYISISSIQTTAPNAFLLRGSIIDQPTNQQLQEKLSVLGEVQETRFETIGPTLGKELIRKTLTSIIIATGFIMIYVTSRFKDKKYGVCAILAMLHDSFIMLGVFSFLGAYQHIEVDALFVTALLTILSFSVHDTIVVYDRIRETLKLHPKLTFTQTVNKAVTETLGRSVNNSMTIIFMLLSLFLLGGETTQWFIFALLIGTISGTYSSTFTAAPLLVLWEEIKQKKNN